MASSHIKIHEQCIVAPPPPAATQTSLPLTFFDLIWLRLFPIEYVFSYTTLQSDPSLFFQHVVPKLKASLSLTLQHFLPLSGNIVWPSHSEKPFVQFNPGDGVSLVIAESSADLKDILDNSPRDALESRSLLPYLESSDSHSSVISLQITLFPNSGFCIGVSASHVVVDAKSLATFIKAWASLSQTNELSSSPHSLVPGLEPLFDREVIKDLNHGLVSDGRSLKMQPYFEPKVKVDAVRATFELTRGDLEKVRKKMLSSKWDCTLVEGEDPTSKPPMPTTLSTFVVMSGYVSVCMAKAIQGVENERNRFSFLISVDCRSKLAPPIPGNYIGNCVSLHFADALPTDFVKEDGMVIAAKSIHNKIKTLKEGIIRVEESDYSRYVSLAREGAEVLGVAGSNRFGMYGVDFGWGRPAKVEMVSVDRGAQVGLTENKDGNGVQLGLVLSRRAMDLFSTLFHAGLRDD